MQNGIFSAFINACLFGTHNLINTELTAGGTDFVAASIAHLLEPPLSER